MCFLSSIPDKISLQGELFCGDARLRPCSLKATYPCTTLERGSGHRFQ